MDSVHSTIDFVNREFRLTGNTSVWTMKWTPFHTAVLHSDRPFLNSLFEQLHEKQKIFVCNALVNSTDVNMFNENTLDKLDDIGVSENSLKQISFKKDLLMLSSMLELVLTIAVLSGNVEIVQYLLDNGLSMNTMDSNGSTVFHCLAYIAKDNPEIAIQFYRYLVDQIKDPDVKLELLTRENNDGECALDIAAKIHSLEYLIELFHTDGVYRFVTLHYGNYQQVLYDVSKYEQISGCINKIHFLYNISLVQEDELCYFESYKLLELEPFKTWHQSKIALNKKATNLWTCNIIFIISLYFTQMILFYFGEPHSVSMSISVVLLVMAILQALIQLISFCTHKDLHWHIVKVWWNKGLPVGYLVNQFMFEVSFLFYLILLESLYLSGFNCCDFHNGFVYVNLNTASLGCLSLLLFTQRYERVAHLLTLINRMIWDVMLFLAIWGLMHLMYSTVFFLLSHDSVWYNATDTAAPRYMFATFGQSMYDTFLIGLHLLPPSPLYFEHSTYNVAMMILYTVFIVIVSLVIVNMIIAKMTQNVHSLHTCKTTVKFLQAINMALLMEDMGNSIICCLTGCNTRLMHKYYLISQDKTQMFLKVLEKLPHLNNNMD